MKNRLWCSLVPGAVLAAVLALCIPVCAAALPAEVSIYAVDTAWSDRLSVPGDLPRSYSLAGHTWEILEGESVEIDPDGTVKIPQTTWYYHTGEDGWVIGSTSPSGSEDEFSRQEYSFGDSVILVDGAHRLTVHAVSYAKYYAQQVMDGYLAAHVDAHMTQYEAARLCCRFVAEGYDYSTEASDYTGMILTGGGDCWASTSALLYMLGRQGIPCSARDASADPGAGGRHVNVTAELDGSYYILEAGYTGSAPRDYRMTKLESASVFTYSATGRTTAEVTGLVLDSGITHLVIPEVIDGYTITAVADGSFSGNGSLVSVTLPDTVTYLGKQAFFQNYALESVDLPEQLHTIGANCFTWDKALREVTLPAAVEEIQSNVFCYCSGLGAINVDPGNQTYRSVDGVLFDKEAQTLLIFPGGKGEPRPDQYAVKQYLSGLTKTYTLPDGVRAIAGWAFAGVNLAEVRFPGSLEEIGGRAFYSAFIRTLELPEGLTSIPANAFYDVSLTNLSLPASLRRIESGAFCRAGIYGPVQLPEGLVYVGDSAFDGVQGLYIRVPASVGEIGANAFHFQNGWSSMGGGSAEKTGYEGAIFFDRDCAPASIGENAFGREVLCVYPDSAMHQYARQQGLFWHPLDRDGKVELKQEWLEGVYDPAKLTYTGLPLTPLPKWASAGKGTCPFAISTDAYAAVYTGNVNIGTASAVITGKGFFSGTAEISFQIGPADPDSGAIDRSGCGLQYKIEDGRAEIVSFIAGALPRHVVIPAVLDGCPVTEIGYHAFSRKLGGGQPPELASVAIPDSVTEIDRNAFSYYHEAGEGVFLETLPAGLVIYARRGSYAEDYAGQRGILFLPVTAQTDPAQPQPVELAGWTLTADGGTAVRLVDSTGALAAGGSVYAARYGRDGRMTDVLAGSVRDSGAVFARPLSEEWFVFILNAAHQPLGKKCPLSPELRS